MMKLREIILDFTSLLDVFMLILFFFILFSHFEVTQAQDTMEQVKQEAQQTIESMQEHVDEELALLDEANHLKAVNVQALMQFSNGTVMQSKLIMNEDAESWTLELRCKDVQLAVLDNPVTLTQELIRILQNQSFTPEDKIPFIFFYDGTEPGSESAFTLISSAFREVRQTYSHFYCIESDISDFGE